MSVILIQLLGNGSGILGLTSKDGHGRLISTDLTVYNNFKLKFRNQVKSEKNINLCLLLTQRKITFCIRKPIVTTTDNWPLYVKLFLRNYSS